MRLLIFFAGLVVLLGCVLGLLVRLPVSEATPQEAPILSSDFDRLKPGVTQAAQLPLLGFDTSGAERLSYLAMVEQFMPGDSFAFDALAPAVQDCFEGRARCDGYIFPLADRSGARALVLIQGGRVAYKSLSGEILTSAIVRVRSSSRE